LLAITNAERGVIESLYSSHFLQIVATLCVSLNSGRRRPQCGGQGPDFLALPRISANRRHDLRVLATLWAYLTQKHRDNAGPELCNNPVLSRRHGMGDVINFRKARKIAERSLHGGRAAANRLKHGRTKTERKLVAARDAKARHDLDQHRVDTGE
jgi:Domain of unknown function (DUF4169)